MKFDKCRFQNTLNVFLTTVIAAKGILKDTDDSLVLRAFSNLKLYTCTFTVKILGNVVETCAHRVLRYQQSWSPSIFEVVKGTKLAHCTSELWCSS